MIIDINALHDGSLLFTKLITDKKLLETLILETNNNPEMPLSKNFTFSKISVNITNEKIINDMKETTNYYRDFILSEKFLPTKEDLSAYVFYLGEYHTKIWDIIAAIQESNIPIDRSTGICAITSEKMINFKKPLER